MLKRLQDFSSSEEYDVLSSLIEASSSNDQESLAQYCSSGIFRAIDPEVNIV